MSEIPHPHLPDGDYHIISDVKAEAAGVNAFLPIETQDVRLGGDARVWTVKKVPESESLYNLGLKDRFHYSGVRDDKVIASQKSDVNSLWYLILAFNGVAIAWDHDHKKVWTVADETDPHSEIVIKDIEYGRHLPYPPPVIPTQGFRFIPVHY